LGDEVLTYPPVTFPATVVHTWTPQYPDFYRAVGGFVAPGGSFEFWSTNIYAITSESDVDGNHLLDGWEYGYWGHLGESEFDNPDGDLLNNRQEWEADTDPLDWDTDDDGNPDGFENPPPEIGRDAHIVEYSSLSSHNTGGNSENEVGEYRWYFDDQKTWLLEPALNELRQPDAGELIILKVYYDHERNGDGSPKELGVYLLNRDWGEGQGSGIDGREALPGEVNWTWAKQGTELWEIPGARGPTDAGPTSILTFTVTDNYGPLLFDVTTAMTPFITDPSGFHGFKIENTSPEPEIHGTKVFASYQNLNADRHPRLYVGTMDLPPEIELTVVPTQGVVPLETTIEIDAADPDGTVQTVVIDYGDGDTEEIAYSGLINRTHTYISKGTYIIVVTATDDDSLTANASETIQATETHSGDFAVDPLYGVAARDGLPGDTIILTSGTISFEGTPAVAFGGIPATVTEIVSAGEMSVEVPEGAVSGFVTVNMGGDLYTSGEYFHVLDLLSATGKDAHILEYGPLSTNNTGMNAQMDVGEYNVHLLDRKTVLIEPDISGVATPVANEIYYLELYCEGERNGIGESKNFGLYTLLREWNEGNGLGINGRSALDEEVTWYSASQGLNDWEIPGALGATDSEQQIEGAVSIADEVGWIRIPVTEAISEAIANPGSFHGFKLQELSPLSAHNGSKLFATYQSEYDHHKPRLTKHIEGPPPGYPIIGLEIDPMGGEPPLECSFTVYAEDNDGTVETLHIDFGDITDADLDPEIVNEFTHTYSDTGRFLVQVTATDNEGHVWVEKRDVVVELSSPITFDLDPPMGKIDDIITLVSTEITFWGTPYVEIDGVPAAATIDDADHISVTIPADAQSGWVELVIDGTRYTSSERFILLEVLSSTGIDAHILENMPTRNTGGYFENEIGEYNWTLNLDEKTHLIKPDLTGIELPAGSDFSIYLELEFDHERNGNGTPKTFGLYELLKEWNEGIGAGWIDGQEATSGEVTWNSSKHLDQTWETPGAKGVTDAEQTPLDTVTLSDNYGIFRLDVTEAIIDALDVPSSYHGFKLQEELPLAEANGTKVLHSYQWPNPDARPKLVLTDTWAWGDADGDDMPNQWETQYGLDPNDPGDATEDLDGDGYLNVYEYVHETDPANPAQIPPATITVTTTIQDAINASANDYDIVMVPDGTYTGSGNKDLDFHGKVIMLTSGNGAENCVIDCQNDNHGFHINDNEGRRTVVRGITVRNGNQPLTSYGLGGGVYLRSSPTFDGCVIANCSAFWKGGGIYCQEASPLFKNCVFFNNTAITEYGGAVYFKLSSPEFFNCTICDNTARLGGGIFGMVAFEGSLVENCIIWGNSHLQMYVDGGGIEVNHSDIQGGWTGVGNINSDPLLDADYRLTAGSPCIDAGTAQNAPTTDRDGEARWDFPDVDNGPSIVDMGADEYVADSAYLPYITGFEPGEGFSIGDLDGQNGWLATLSDTVVQNTDKHSGDQAVSLQGQEAEMNLQITSSVNDIKTEAYIRFPSAGTFPPVVPPEAKSLVAFDPSVGLKAYDDGVWVLIPGTAPIADSWVKVVIVQHFGSGDWDVEVYEDGGTPLGSLAALPFGPDTGGFIEGIHAVGISSGRTDVDDISLIDVSLPEGPSTLTFANIAAHSVDLNWDDNADNETGYAIYRRTDLVDPWQLAHTTGADATSWTDTGLLSATEYFYKVHAENDTGLSVAFADGSVTTSENPPWATGFESPDYTTGSLHGQQEWSLSSGQALVQNSTVHGNTQAVSIQGADATVSHALLFDRDDVTTEAYLNIPSAGVFPPTVPSGAKSLVAFDPAVGLRAYRHDTQEWLAIPNTSAIAGSWVKIVIVQHFDTARWDVAVYEDGEPSPLGQLTAIPMGPASGDTLDGINIVGISSDTTYVDDISITE